MDQLKSLDKLLIDSGSSTSIMLFSLFKEIRRKDGLMADFLRDYSHHPILIAAIAEVEIEFQGRCVTTTLNILSDRMQGSALFLLGTNAIISLGLIHLSNNVRVHPAEEGSDHLPESITVRLLRTEHLPGYYGAVLRTRLD